VNVPCPACGAERWLKYTTPGSRWYADHARTERCKRCGQKKSAAAKRSQVGAKKQRRPGRQHGEEPTGDELDDLARLAGQEQSLAGTKGYLGSYQRELFAAERNPGDAEYEKAFRARLDAEEEARQRAKNGLPG
jgi:hypothetical protein